MKKYFIIILILLASITSIYALNGYLSNNLSLDNITQINVYYKDELKSSFSPENDSAKNDTQDYQVLIDSLNSMKKTEFTLESTPNHKIDIIDKEGLYSYFIDANALDSPIYIMHKDQVYTLDDSNRSSMLSSTFLDEIYYYDDISDITLNIEDISLIPTIAGDITFTSISGEKREKSIQYSSENYLTSINDFDKSNMVKIDFPSKPKILKLRIFDSETLLDEYALNSDEFGLLKREGTTTYEVIASWSIDDEKQFVGDISYKFDVDLDLKPEFKLTANNKGPGEFFIIRALYFNDKEKPLVKSDFVKDKHFKKIGNEYLLLIPLDYYQKKSKHKVDFYVSKDNVETLIDSIDLIIENRSFTSQNLTINKSTLASTSNDNAYSEFAKYFTPVREQSNPSPYFNDSFMLPIDGRISTEFGMMRYVNGSLTSYRHSGIDIAVPRGTKVPATNSGKIVLSRELILTGNTVVIDHGAGIFSVYYHMDTLNVSLGDMVKKADIIGTVGSTGRSTGPHLHFTTSIYKTNVNPKFLIDLSKDELNNLIN